MIKVISDNTAAINTYKKCGFKEFGRRTRCYFVENENRSRIFTWEKNDNLFSEGILFTNRRGINKSALIMPPCNPQPTWPIHYILADASGNMAVIEYIQGERKIFTGKDIVAKVVTTAGMTRRALYKVIINK